MDVSPYLRRIGYDGPLEPTIETLRGLHRAHLLTVPFENLDIPLKRPIALFRDRLFQKIVLRRRGGFCYELNGLFAELLKNLGFDVTLLSARVMINPSRVPPEFDHLALLVTFFDGGRWLADVGFGDSFVEPLPLVNGEEHAQLGYVYALVELAKGRWATKRRRADSQVWEEMYELTLVPRQLSEFVPMCCYHQTSPESGFTKRRVCSMATKDGRKTLAEGRFIVTRGADKTEREVGEGEYYRVLRDEFGVEL